MCIGESLATAAIAAEIASENPGFVFSTAGVHPHDAATFDAARDIPRLRLASKSTVAIGECGLDYHYDNSPRDAQLGAFAAQIALAGEMSRPLVVHTRDAEDDTGAMIREAKSAGVIGVLHCYTGSHSLADLAIGVAHTLTKVASARGDDPNELGQTTARNAERLFGLAFEAA